MVIGFDGSRAFIPNKTGTENYSYQLLKALAKIDRKNQYIVYIRSDSDRNSWPDNFKFQILNFKFLWTQIGLALRTFIDPLDVLFVPAHTLPLIRRPNLKTVVTVHDLGSEYLPSMHQFKQKLYLGLMQRYQLKGASQIIAVSKATKMDLINKIGIDSRKITVVYEGFDKERFKIKDLGLKNDIKSDILKQYGIVWGKYFLFVGTVQPRKNLERVITAFSHQLSALRRKTKKSDDCRLKTDDYFLVIAGSKGWLSDEIYSLPKKLGIEDRVKFLGYVPDRELPALCRGAIALVFPSLFEGFGLPILEAQACGCPVITSNISSMPEVACLPAGRAGKGAILVDPYSVEEITNAMIRVKGKACLPARQAERGKLIKEGLENVKRFSWEKCAAQTLKVF